MAGTFPEYNGAFYAYKLMKSYASNNPVGVGGTFGTCPDPGR